jgi:hypothetical protein
MSGLSSGYEQLKADLTRAGARAGIGNMREAEQFAREREAEAAKTYRPVERFSEDPLNYLGGRIGSSLPYAVPSIIAGGVAAATAPVGLPALLAAGAAGTAAGIPIFTGSNITRQVKEGTPLERTDLGAAVGSAVVQSGLDAVGNAFIPGVSKILGIPAKAAQNLVEQTVRRKVLDYTLSAGKAATAESITETAQQVFERMQAGLDLTDDKARAEYLDSAFDGALLGGVFGGVGRRFERGAEQGRYELGEYTKTVEANQKALAERRRLEAEEKAKKDAIKNAPEYLLGLNDNYLAAKQKLTEMKIALGKKPDEDTDPAAFDAWKRASRDATKFRKETYNPLLSEYKERKGDIDPLVTQRTAEQKLAETQASPPATPVVPAPPVEQPTAEAPPTVQPIPEPAVQVDPLYDQAVEFVSGPGRPSISAVQREFKIGYNRAGRLIAQMEQNGIVTPMDSKGGRQLVGAEQPAVVPQVEPEVVAPAPFEMGGMRLGFQPNVAEPAAIPDTEPGPATITKMPVVPAATNFQPAPSTSMTPEEAAADAATRQQDSARVMYEGMAAKFQAAGKPIPPELAARLAALQPAAPAPAVEMPAAPVVETPAAVEVPAAPTVETSASVEVPAAPVVETPAAPAPAPIGKATWRSADSDFPVEVIGQPLADPKSGRKYVEVLFNNNKSFVPADELVFETPAVAETPAAPVVETPAVAETPAAPVETQPSATATFGTNVEEGLNVEYPNIGSALFRYTQNGDVKGIDEAVSDIEYPMYINGLHGLLKEMFPSGVIPVRHRKEYAGFEDAGQGPMSVSINPNWGGAKAQTFDVPISDVIAAGNTDESELIIKRPTTKPEAAAPTTPVEPVKPPSITEAPAPFSADIKPIKSDIPTLRDIERGWFYPAQPMMLGNLLVNDSSYHPVKLQVTDNPQFHSGKMEQAPISVEFRPDSVSGAKQAALPTGGGVYNTNVVAPQAVQSVSMTTATAKKLPAPIKAALAEKFDAATSGNDITYTRKQPVEQEAEAAPAETVAPTEEAPKPRVRRVAKAPAPAVETPAPAVETPAPAVETPATAETVEPATQPQGAATEPVVQRKGKRVVKVAAPEQSPEQQAKIKNIDAAIGKAEDLRIDPETTKAKVIALTKKSEKEGLISPQDAKNILEQTKAMDVEDGLSELISAFEENKTAASAPVRAATAEQTAPAEAPNTKESNNIREALPAVGEGATRALENHYGFARGTAEFISGVSADLATYASKGLSALAKGIAKIIAKLYHTLIATSFVFNATNINLPETVVITPKVVRTVVQQVMAPVPASVSARMSENAKQAYASLYPALQARLKEANKLFIIADKPNARLFVFAPDGTPILDHKVLIGKAMGDFYRGNNEVEANRITPAGLFKMGLRDAQRSPGEMRTAGEYDFQKVFVLDKAVEGEYSTTLFHSIWLKESDAKMRAAAIAKEDPTDSRYSFGCINVDKASYKFLLDNHLTQMDGASLFVVPDNSARIQDFLFGDVAKNKTGEDILVRDTVEPATETKQVVEQEEELGPGPAPAPVEEEKGPALRGPEAPRAREREQETAEEGGPPIARAPEREAEPEAEPEPDLGERWPETGDPYAGYAEDVTRVPTVPVVRILAGLRKKLAGGEITNEQFIEQTQQLLERVEAANQQRARNREIKAAQGMERGSDIVREKLLAARRRGELDYATVEFGLWLLNNNPQLAYGLAVSLLTPGKKTSNLAGMYTPVTRVMTLFKNVDSGDALTAVHEILHHAERMMPAKVQARIRAEYYKVYAKKLAEDIKRSIKLSEAAVKSGAVTSKNLLDFIASLEDNYVPDFLNRANELSIPQDVASAIIKAHVLARMGVAQTGDEQAQQDVMSAFGLGLLKASEYYHLFNASEFWAVKASEILHRRYSVGSWQERARNWLREMLEKAKGFIGLRSESSLYKGLDAVIRGDGAFVSPAMLSDDNYNYANIAAPTNQSFVAGKTSNVQALRNTFKGTAGLAVRQKALDSYASMDEALKKGFEQGIIDSTEAGNVQFALRMGQQRNHFAGMALTNGPLQLIKDVTAKGAQYIYRSVKGANLQDVAKELNKSGIKADKLENYFTVYMVGQRANVVGWDKVNVGNPAKAKTEYNNVMQIINANPKALTAFKNAEAIYTEYNKGLINFLEQTGTITKALAQELNSKPYVPYYRVDNKSGDLLLDLDKSVKPVRIGNIKDEPRLQELVGGEQKIMGIFDSAVQNTFLLTDMALRNQAIKESAFVLNKLGMASYIGKAKKNLSGKDVVRFKVNGEDHIIVIDTDQFGIPAKLIVEGMEGIKTMIPSVVRAMGFPADVLRKFVTRNPVYALRQVVRDSMNSFFTTGIDSTPVLSALKQGVSLAAGKNSKAQKLMESGAISNLVFTGGKEDAQRLVEQIATGKSGWTKLIGKLDALSLAGDATTRITIYEDSIRKGLTEQEALLRTLESQNFTRRGTSASLQQLAAVVPFLNAQLQGLDVLYRSSQGKMPFEQQMRIRSKFFQRAVLMSASTVAYAALMEDDERYKKAKPEERYGNWFLVNPMDPKGDLIRVPIPFEIGLIFKAVPEAIYNTLKGNDTSENAARGIFKLLEQSNPFTPIPAALKPGVEVFLGTSFFGGPIESARELAVEKSERIRPGTSAGAELLGKANMLSPVQIDHLIRGHFGALGVLISDLAAVLPFGKGQEVQERTKNLSEMRVIGTLFQPAEGRGIIDEAYRRMKDIDMARKTYKKMLSEGRSQDAQEYLESHRSDINLSQMAGAVENKIGKLAELRRSIEARPNLTTEQKDAQIKNIIAAQNRLAQTMLTSYAQTARQ